MQTRFILLNPIIGAAKTVVERCKRLLVVPAGLGRAIETVFAAQAASGRKRSLTTTGLDSCSVTAS